MNCRAFYGFLDEFLSEALDPLTLKGFLEHIQDCPPCLRYLDTYRASVRTARDAELVDIPIDTSVPEELVQAILVSRRSTS